MTVPAEAGEAFHVQSFFPDRAILPTTSPSLSYPLEVAANGPEDYFTPPPGVNLIAMFKSPMVMMMLFSAVMAIALPKITVSSKATHVELTTRRRWRTTPRSRLRWTLSASAWPRAWTGADRELGLGQVCS